MIIKKKILILPKLRNDALITSIFVDCEKCVELNIKRMRHLLYRQFGFRCRQHNIKFSITKGCFYFAFKEPSDLEPQTPLIIN